jgi:hypothetical protein
MSSSASFKRAWALELGDVVATDQVAAAPSVGRPSLLRPWLLTQVTCLPPMDIARHRGTRPSAKDRMEPPDRARRRRRPDEAHSDREKSPARRCYCSSSRERQRRPLAPGPQPRQNETAQASATLVGQHGVRWRLRTAHGLDSGADIICCGCTRTGRGGYWRAPVSAKPSSSSAKAALAHPAPSCGGHSPSSDGRSSERPSGWGVARTAQIIECAAARLSRRTAHPLLYLPPQIGRERAGRVPE